MEVILNRHAKLEDIDGLSAGGAATSPQAKAAKAKCVQGDASPSPSCCALCGSIPFMLLAAEPQAGHTAAAVLCTSCC